MRRTSPARGRTSGFTLIETAMAIVVIGVGVIAMVDAQQAFMQSNAWSSHAATATLLANEVREFTRYRSRHDPVTGLFLDGDTLVGWGPEEGEDDLLDYDDLDDFDGLQLGGEGGDFPGPVNAFGEVIYELNIDGTIKVDEQGEPIPLQGWTQTVIVEKLDAFDYAIVRTDDATDEATDTFNGRDVDGFPLRVTVIVSYQGSGEDLPEEVTRVSWIVPW